MCIVGHVGGARHVHINYRAQNMLHMLLVSTMLRAFPYQLRPGGSGNPPKKLCHRNSTAPRGCSAAGLLRVPILPGWGSDQLCHSKALQQISLQSSNYEVHNCFGWGAMMSGLGIPRGGLFELFEGFFLGRLKL